jgi:hypothetical protein
MQFIQFTPSNSNGLRLSGIASGMIYLATMVPPVFAAPEATPDAKPQGQSEYGKLPLSFEANQGQTDRQVRFLTRGQGYALFLTPTEAVLTLRKPHNRHKGKAKASPSSVKSSSTPEMSGAVLRMQLIGANPAPQVLGEEELPGRVNYLIGNDPGQWRTQVPTYGKIVYEDVYSGVNLVYYGNQGQLEYDFVVAPGADPGQVNMAFQGADQIAMTPEGELVLHTADSEVKMRKPVIYQEIGGVRKPVDGSYKLKGDRQVGFQVKDYDDTRPLIIDPVLVYSSFLGGVDNDLGYRIAVDKRGQAYIVGFACNDFPTTPNSVQPDFGGPGCELGDAFVAKFRADGSALNYATFLGGKGHDDGRGIAVDQQGRAYVTGLTESFDFPTQSAFQPAHGSDININYGINNDAFVAQLSADGSALRYSTYFGGGGEEFGINIAVDQRGQAYVTGDTRSTDSPTKNPLQPALGGDTDVFVARFSADGRTLGYATYLGGSGDDSARCIAVDQRGQAYVAGSTGSADFPTKNPLQPALSGNGDGFVARFSADGRALSYATYLGGSGDESARGIAVDQRGQAYVTGFTGSDDFPAKNPFQPTLNGNTDAFIARFNADGRALSYATYFGGSGGDSAGDIALDQRGQIYIAGGTGSDDFPTKNPLQPTLNGTFDAFVARFSADGRTLGYATYLGGSGGESARGIAVDQRGQAYVTGDTNSFDYPTVNAFRPVSVGSPFNGFIAKIGSNGR